MDKVEHQARELLAAEYAKDERYGMAHAARNGSNDVMPAIRAIIRALSQQPEPKAEARGGVDDMTGVINDLRHSARVDDYEPQQIAFLESIADRIAALTESRNGR